MSQMKNGVFYKYRELDTNALKQISGNYVWMSDPNKFNDPYDTYLRYHFSGSSESWIRFLDKGIKDLPKDDTEKFYVAAKETPEILANLFNSDYLDTIASIEKVRSQFLVCSFSRRWDSPPLWSHYSAEHTGICIGYRSIRSNEWDLLEVFDDRIRDVISVGDRTFVPLVEVKYTKAFVGVINPVEGDGSLETMRESLRTKYWDWRYEKEYRLIKFKDGVQDVRLRLGTIQEVLLGARMTSSDEQFMLEFIEALNMQWQLSIRVYRMRLDDKKFQLRKVRLV